MPKVVFFLIILHLFSCQSDKASGFNKIEDLTFNTGFFSMNAQIEYFNNKEFLCIGDYHTHKKIAIHDLNNSDSLIFIPLNQITDLGEKILAFEALNLDTIIVLPYYSNILYFINRNGEIWNSIDLNPYLEKEGYFELSRSSTPFQFNDTTLIFSLNYLSKNLPLKSRGDLNMFYQKKQAAPSLFKISNIFDRQLNTKFGLRNLYTTFIPANSVNIEGNLFNFYSDKIIFNSAYSDSLYIINYNSLEIERKIHIHSKYTDLFIKPITIQEFQMTPESINTNFNSDGQIRSILYDSDKNQYSVIVNHKPKGKLFPWSIITLDRDFNKINEKRMDASNYYSKVWKINKGLLISNYFETLSDPDHFEKNTFTLFGYE